MEVKQFKPLLAGEYDAVKQVFPCFGSAKFDGVRAMVRGNALMSRQLKPIKNDALQDLLGCDMLEGLDGELIVGVPTAKDVFKKSQQLCSRQHDSLPADWTFRVFDCFEEPASEFHHRLNRARQKVKAFKHKNVVMVPHVLVNNADELRGVEDEMVRTGYEGLMLRRKDGVYKMGRSTTNEGILLKFKRFAHMEAEVLGAFEQMENTNAATISETGATKRSSHKAGKIGKGTLGGFHVKGINGPFKGVEFDVGTGWTDDERYEAWIAWQGLTPRQFNENHGYLRVKYQPVGSDKKPRFPIADGWRSPEDV